MKVTEMFDSCLQCLRTPLCLPLSQWHQNRVPEAVGKMAFTQDKAQCIVWFTEF